MRLSFDTRELIAEIEKRPTIWDMTISEYSDKLARKRCWEELTDIFSTEKTTQKDKIALNELLQKKWKNIRDRFSRESKSGENLQYIYSKQLQFLKKLVKHRQTSTTVMSNGISQMCMPTEKSLQSASADSLDMSYMGFKPSPQKRSRTDNGSAVTTFKNNPSTSTMFLDVSDEESNPSVEKRSKTDNLVETKLLRILERNLVERQEKTKTCQDEDRLFLMSLFTSLKSVPPQYKLKAKIEILSVLEKYSKIYEELGIISQPQIVEVNSMLSCD